MCILTGPDFKYTFANNAYKKLIGRHNILNRTVREVLPEVVKQGFIKVLDNVYTSGQAHHAEEVPVIIHKNNQPQKYYLDITYQPLFDADNSIYGIFVQANDISRQVELRKDKVLLLQELDHRVRNNLTIIMGLIDMQADEINQADPLLSLQNTRKRVGTFVKVHELIFSQRDLRNIPVHELLKKLSDPCRNYDRPGFTIEIMTEPLFININQALPLGLICNEMLSWFMNRAAHIHRISIGADLTRQPEVELIFTVDTDKDSAEEVLLWDDRSFEGRLISLLLLQLKAKLEVTRSTGKITLAVKLTKAYVSGSGADYFLSFN